MFNNYPHEERVEMFQANSDAVEERIYFEELSDEELIERRSRFAQRSIEIAKIEDKKKEIVDEFKSELEPLKHEAKFLLSEIKTGHTEKEGKIYKMVDHEEGMVGYYSQAGNLVEQRPATREERSQLSITSIKGAVTN